MAAGGIPPITGKADNSGSITDRPILKPHSATLHSASKSFLYPHIHYFGCFPTALFLTSSQSEKEYFQKRFKNVYVINNPVMPGLPHPYSGERKKVIVNFCRMTPQKNLSVLLEAFQKFHNEYPEYILKIFGNTQEKAEAEEKNKLVGRISDLKLADCAFILPPVPDVHEKIIDSAMFVSSSDYEGLSNTMLEAMAIGLPCVCTDCLGGGTREVMVDHENGLIVPMKDPESMYRAMKEYVENQELAEKCSMNAARIRDRLSVEKITQQWLDVIEG